MSGRRSKPNRGGGRFNKPRGGGGGGGGNRKAASGCWDDEDDFNLDLGPSRSFKPPSSRGSRGVRGARGGTGRGTGRGTGGGTGRGTGGGTGRGTGGGTGGGTGRGTGRGRSQVLTRKYDDEEEKRSRFRPDQVQLPLQKIHMTSENKLQVKELLRELQSHEYQTPNRWTWVCFYRGNSGLGSASISFSLFIFSIGIFSLLKG